MDITQQAVFLPMLREIKEKMVKSEVLGRFVRDQKPISYYWLIMVTIESSVDSILYWEQTDIIAEALWRLFGNEVLEIYRLVKIDREDAPESLRQCFVEAKAQSEIKMRVGLSSFIDQH